MLGLALTALLAASTPVATVPELTPLRALGDTVVWSADSAAGYRLTMQRGGRSVTIPVAPRGDVGDFDIGTDASGRPLLAYTRCRRSCDIYTATLAGHERRIAAASAPHEDERAPAVSEGRLAWLRGRRVYTRRLSDPPSRPSRRLYTLGRRYCPSGRSSCVRIRGRSIDELDVSGRRVAFLISFELPDFHPHYLVRIADARTGRVVRVRDVGTGESGQFVFGLGFHAGRLGWAMSCHDDPEGCNAGGYRYLPGRRVTEHTTDVRQSIGLTLSGARQAYVLQGTRSDGSEGEFLCPCRIERRDVRWR